MKKYKIAGKIFTTTMQLEQFERVKELLGRLGLNVDILKKIYRGENVTASEAGEFGVSFAMNMLEGSTLRELVALLVARLPLYYRLWFVGPFLFKKYYHFSEEKYQANLKTLGGTNIDELTAVLNDFFAGMMTSMILSNQSLSALRLVKQTATKNLKVNLAQ